MSRYFSAILWILTLQAISFALSVSSPLGADVAWYVALQKSALTPPDYVFGIVWPILYLMIALSGWKLWDDNANPSTKKFFIAQILFNWSWMPVFVNLQLFKIGAVIILATLLSTIMVVVHSCKDRNHMVSALLTPYILWMCFASYLNLFIAFNN